MARKRKIKIRGTQVEQIRKIAKNNPHVNEETAAASIELIVTLRKSGIRPKGFNILGISDSKLKVRNPAIFSLTK